MPEFRGNEALGLIRGGLRDFSVSRTSLKWGIPLPWDPKHVAYVWFDALTNYLTAVGFGDRRASGSTDWWPVDVHLIGKDIIRHHCVYWPAMLMSAGIEPPRRLGRRRLAARRRREDEQDHRQRGEPARPGRHVGVDGFRYYVLADTPYGNDGDFTHEGLIGRYNADLANNLGNLLARVATVVEQEVRRHRPGTRGRTSPLADAAGDARTRRPPRRGRRSRRAAPSRPPGR